MWRALVLAPFSPAQLERLRQRLEVTYESWLDTRKLHDPDDLARRLHEEGISILVVESDFVFEEVFQQAPGLKFVGICRAATNHVDVEVATRQGVVVVNTPTRNAQAVAEHALGLMLALARRIPAAHQYVAQRRWTDPVGPYITMRGVELCGKTLGIIGLGAIGRRLAAMGLALGMAVQAHDPYVAAPPEGVRLMALDGLLAQSDFVSIHAPLTPETEGLLDARRLGLMKPTAYLVNTSAAAIVRQEALVEALRGRRIAGAALDVFESHPLPPGSPLLGLDNVVLTPHIGGATAETIERHSEMMSEDILRFVRGERPLRLVNPEVWPPHG